jgi:hypothetical protein
MYETIYTDTEGRPILVIGELEAFTMVGEAIKEEREACAKRLDALGCDHCADAIRSRGKE